MQSSWDKLQRFTIAAALSLNRHTRTDASRSTPHTLIPGSSRTYNCGKVAASTPLLPASHSPWHQHNSGTKCSPLRAHKVIKFRQKLQTVSTTTNLGRPRTAPGPLSLWRLLLTGGHWPGHLGLVAAHSVAGEGAAAVFDVGAAAAHTGDTLDNTALLPCPAQLMGQGTRHRGNTPPDTRPP